MKYKNIRTGTVITTSGKISGDDWREAPAEVSTKGKSASTRSVISGKTETRSKKSQAVKK